MSGKLGTDGTFPSFLKLGGRPTFAGFVFAKLGRDGLMQRCFLHGRKTAFPGLEERKLRLELSTAERTRG